MSSPQASHRVEDRSKPVFGSIVEESTVTPPKTNRSLGRSLIDDDSEKKTADSPTSVLDFGDTNRTSSGRARVTMAGVGSKGDQDMNSSSKKRSSAPGNNTNEIFRQINPPSLAATPSTSRRSRQYFTSSLPTLDETSSSESSETSFDEEEEDDILGPIPGTSPSKSKHAVLTPLVNTENTLKVQQRKLAGPGRKQPGAAPRTAKERVSELTEKADDLASVGEEEKALVSYKKALKVNRHETARIKSQLRQVDGKHPSTVQSIASRLHEDWLEVGHSIADIRCKMAILCERVGDYDRAIACCKEAEGVYKRQMSFLQKNKSKEEITASKKKAKDVKMLLVKLEVAHDSFEDRKANHEEIVALQRALSLTHNPQEKKKLYDAIEKQLRMALKVESDVLGKDHPQVADSLSLMATLAMENGDLAQALEHMKKAVSITMNSLGMKHPLTGETFLQMARIYATQNPVDEISAVKYYEKAVTVFRATERSHLLLGSTLNEISVIRIRQRKTVDAIELLKDALEAFEVVAKEKQEGEINTDTVQVWRNLGECYASQKDFQKATEAFVTALDLQREARKLYDAAMTEYLTETAAPPAYLVDDESIGDTLRRLAKSYMGYGKYEDALTMFIEALLIHRAAVVKAVDPTLGRPNDRLSDRQDQLAHTLFCIAELRELTGEQDEALRVYGESMQLRLFSDAHRPNGRQNMVHCAMCLRGIGNVHMRKGEFEAAEKVFEDALRYCEGHGKSSPENIAPI